MSKKLLCVALAILVSGCKPAGTKRISGRSVNNPMNTISNTNSDITHHTGASSSAINKVLHDQTNRVK